MQTTCEAMQFVAFLLHEWLLFQITLIFQSLESVPDTELEYQAQCANDYENTYDAGSVYRMAGGYNPEDEDPALVAYETERTYHVSVCDEAEGSYEVAYLECPEYHTRRGYQMEANYRTEVAHEQGIEDVAESNGNLDFYSTLPSC